MQMSLESILTDVASDPNSEPVMALKQAFENLPDDKKRAIERAILNIPPPDQSTSNRVWLVVIWTFTTVTILSAVTLSVSVFWSPATDATKPELILTVFTAVTAFLAGLLAPSPIGTQK